MAGIKSFAKAMLCSRDFRDFVMVHRTNVEGEEDSSSKSQGQMVQRRGAISSDIQLGDFFEAIVQYSLVGNTESGIFSQCTSQDWEERVQSVRCAIESCYTSETYDSLIELIGFDDLRKYFDAHAHPGTVDELGDMWRKFHRKFPSSLNLDEGKWARELTVGLELNMPLEGIEPIPKIALRGRCDLVQELSDGKSNVIELKATKRIQLEHTYQLNLYGAAIDGSKLYMCHKGKISPASNHLDERFEILLPNPITKTYCPHCHNQSCTYRY